MVIFPLAPDQTIAQMWSNGARGGIRGFSHVRQFVTEGVKFGEEKCNIFFEWPQRVNIRGAANQPQNYFLSIPT